MCELGKFLLICVRLCSMTWNLLGMLSNTFFRIKMQPKANKDGQLCLCCEHPTKSGGEPGGWMEREAMAKEGGMAVVTEKQAVASTAVDTSKLKTYTLEEASVVTCISLQTSC